MGSSQARRALKALAVVCLLVAFVPVSGMLAKGTRGALVAGSSVELAVRPDFSTAGFQSLLEREAKFGAAGLPEGFLEELPVEGMGCDFYTSQDESVVSFALQGNSEQALERLSACMEQAGWERNLGASVYGATFEKRGGRYQWAFASFTSVSNRTVVVIQGLLLA